MNEELPKLPNGSYPPRNNVETRLGRFFQRINHFFSNEPIDHEVKLIGRIHEMQSTTDKILEELLEFKSFLAEIAEPSIFSLVCNIIDPIVKEITRIQKGIDEQEAITQQVKVFNRYTEWLDKAKLWIELGKNKKYQKEIIQQAILTHTIQEFQAWIDRDVQVIQDYLHNSFHSFDIVDPMKQFLRDGIEPKVTPYIRRLLELKEPPKKLTIHSLTKWRAKADRERENLFGEALHIIDTFTNELMPIPFEEHKDDYSIEILKLIHKLEEGIFELKAQVKNPERLEEKSKKTCIQTLAHLEEEAHRLNSNLSLPQEYVDRVQHVIEGLFSIRQSLVD